MWAERLRARPPMVASVVLAIALALGAVSLWFASPSKIGGFGLVQALPLTYWVALLGVFVVFVWAWRQELEHKRLLLAAVMSAVVLLHGAPLLVEKSTRFAVTWLHIGFIDSIMKTGEAATSYDARFSWPGFFSGGAVLNELSGVPSSAGFALFAPVLATLMYIPPLLIIGRALLPSWRAVWLGVLLFAVGNWVGQDYFAPQTLAFIWFLVTMALILTYFRVRPNGAIGVWLQERSWRFIRYFANLGSRTHEPAELPLSSRVRLALILALTVLFLALASTHQLTPMMLVAGLSGLAVIGRNRPWPLVAALFMITFGFLCYAAQPFWQGHLEDIFGGLGKVGQSVNAGVSERVRGSDEHILVLRIKMLYAASFALLAGLGLLRRWYRSKAISITLIVLAAAPAFVAAAQSYGGEGFLRIFLFGLTGMSFLAAGFFAPDMAKPKRFISALLVVALISMSAVFMVARYGNESFEQNPPSDIALAHTMFEMAPPGSTIILADPNVAAGFDDPVNYNFVLIDGNFVDVEKMTPLAFLKLVSQTPGPYFVLVTQTQKNALEQNSSVGPQWWIKFDRMLSEFGFVEVASGPDGATLYRANTLPPVPTVQPKSESAGGGQ